MIRLLYVEDERDIREIALVSLRDVGGFDVTLAESGRDALEKVEAADPEVILLDVMMPGMDGLQVCEKLREHPEWRTIPIMLLTAKDDIETRSQGMLLGVSEYLTKPVNKLDLFARLQAQLHSRELERRMDATAAAVAGLAKR